MLNNLSSASFRICHFATVGGEVRFGGGVVGAIDTGHVGDESCSRFFIQAFGVAALAYMQWGVDVYFNEVVGADDAARLLSFRCNRGDECGDDDEPCVHHQA